MNAGIALYFAATPVGVIHRVTGEELVASIAAERDRDVFADKAREQIGWDQRAI